MARDGSSNCRCERRLYGMYFRACITARGGIWLISKALVICTLLHHLAWLSLRTRPRAQRPVFSPPLARPSITPQQAAAGELDSATTQPHALR
jgi:hypothetical protein